MDRSISYADAGVSIDNANLAVAKIREFARGTFNDRTLTEIGSFGGMFSGAFPGMAGPILVASADGVGTKLKLAFEALTPGRQRGYLYHFAGAKQSATRAARIEKATPAIMKGSGFLERR